MNVEVRRSDFFHLAGQAYSLIEKRSIMPILSKALVEAKEGRLYIQATDQDNSLQSSVPAKIQQEGKAVLDAQSLYDILKELPEAPLTLTESKEEEQQEQPDSPVPLHGPKKGAGSESESTEGFSDTDGEEEEAGPVLYLSQKASVFKLMSADVQDFPAFPPFNMDNSFSIKSGPLKQLIEKTVYCSSVDDIRYHLTGVFFEVVQKSKANKKPYFRFVASDGHRLGLAEHFFEGSFDMDKGVIIARKGVQEIKRLLQNLSEEDDVKVAINPARILFQAKGTTLSVKLVEGVYPNYQPFIPEKSFVSVEVPKEELVHTLRRVSILSNLRFKGVTLHVKDKKIKMESANPDLGSAEDELAVLKKTGKDLVIRFNARYLLDALSVIDGPNVLLEFGGENQACMFSSTEKKQKLKKSFGVVMPMRI